MVEVVRDCLETGAVSSARRVLDQYRGLYGVRACAVIEINCLTRLCAVQVFDNASHVDESIHDLISLYEAIRRPVKGCHPCANGFILHSRIEVYEHLLHLYYDCKENKRFAGCDAYTRWTFLESVKKLMPPIMPLWWSEHDDKTFSKVRLGDLYSSFSEVCYIMIRACIVLTAPLFVKEIESMKEGFIELVSAKLLSARRTFRKARRPKNSMIANCSTRLQVAPPFAPNATEVKVLNRENIEWKEPKTPAKQPAEQAEKAAKYVPQALPTPAMYLAVLQDGGSLMYVPEEFRNDEICLAAVKQDGGNLMYVPQALRTEEIYRAAVQQDGRNLVYVPQALRNEEICLAAVQQDSRNLVYVPEELRTAEICRAAVQQESRNVAKKAAKKAETKAEKKAEKKAAKKAEKKAAKKAAKTAAKPAQAKTVMDVFSRVLAIANGNPGVLSLLSEAQSSPSRFESLLALCETHLRNIPNGLWHLYSDVCGKDKTRFERVCDAINADPGNAKGYCEREQQETIYMKYLQKHV